ncbi:hypothetical protein HMPREF0262_01976 [Clostridium sp. ATCC 29733]|nr:hypothetical protein HMPREF0262_01976 [Clostridium sp. ATCC 29733]
MTISGKPADFPVPVYPISGQLARARRLPSARPAAPFSPSCRLPCTSPARAEGPRRGGCGKKNPSSCQNCLWIFGNIDKIREND